MSQADKIKWDKKYTDKPQLLDLRPPSPTLTRFAASAPGRRALDLACGAGRNSWYLVQQGFCVDAVDIADAPLVRLQERIKGLCVTPVQADLDDFIPDKTYDLIVMANYLDRALIERMKRYLNPGGLFVLETYIDHPDNEKKDSDPSFLLQPGETTKIFSGWEILCNEVFKNEPYELYRMYKQGCVARKPDESD